MFISIHYPLLRCICKRPYPYLLSISIIHYPYELSIHIHIDIHIDIHPYPPLRCTCTRPYSIYFLHCIIYIHILIHYPYSYQSTFAMHMYAPISILDTFHRRSIGPVTSSAEKRRRKLLKPKIEEQRVYVKSNRRNLKIVAH